MMPHGIDTSPVIDEYGVCWGRGFGIKTNNSAWGITKWYDVIDTPGTNRTTCINGYVGAELNSITFQYYLSSGTTDWWYFGDTNPRQILINSPDRVSNISFSIEIDKIDDSYAFVVETGFIIFAGKNTPYYGHRNISELN